MFQFLFLKGIINLTSPAVATSIPNLAPGLIFIIAWTCCNFGDFPAPMSLFMITSSIRVIITTMFHLVQVYDLEWDWPLVSVKELIGCSLLGGGVAGGACLSFNRWAMKKRGLVIVSMFSSTGTLITVLSFITLEDTISLGRFMVTTSML